MWDVDFLEIGTSQWILHQTSWNFVYYEIWYGLQLGTFFNIFPMSVRHCNLLCMSFSTHRPCVQPQDLTLLQVHLAYLRQFWSISRRVFFNGHVSMSFTFGTIGPSRGSGCMRQWTIFPTHKLCAEVMLYSYLCQFPSVSRRDFFNGRVSMSSTTCIITLTHYPAILRVPSEN